MLLSRISIPKTFTFIIGRTRNIFAAKVHQITREITINEASFYLRQAIDLCYRSNGAKMPDEFLDWMKNNVKINFLQLPQDVQEGITGVLFHSAKKKIYYPKIYY